MSIQLVSFFLIFYLIFISSKTKLSATIIDSFPNLTFVREDFSIFKCENPIPINVPLFSCKPPSNLTVHDTSCLDKKIFPYNETTCPGFGNRPSPFECYDKNYIGQYCNITNDLCEIMKPCLNNGTCYLNDSLSLKYGCKCRSGFSGVDCKDDNRICKSNTCWHDGNCIEMHGIVSVDNQTTFKCRCKDGYDGTNCELVTDMCVNIVCENNGACIPSHLNWSCQCSVPSFYSGKYCEIKSTELMVKQALSKSFASIAIIAIIIVCLFIIIMDILKYVFNIDPVDRERRAMKLERQRNKPKENRKKRHKKVALKHFYID